MATRLAKSALYAITAGVIGGTVTALGSSIGLTPFTAILPVLTACAVLGALAQHVQQSIAGLGDGPPQDFGNRAVVRFPAFHRLRTHLAPDALIFVDDAHRTTEESMVKRWIREDPAWTPRWLDTVGGVCLLTREAYPTSVSLFEGLS